jgi:hypothetical protein
MRHQSREGEEHKKRSNLAKTGSKEEHATPEVLIDDDIDPADFFDPEEFGFRRNRELLRP